MIRVNEQVVSKQNLRRDGTDLPYIVKEIFYTIQGEGPFAGRPAVFVRMAGCNLNCYFCDTEYSGGVSYGLETLVQQIFATAPADKNDQRPLVVITGGEPFRQNIVPLVNALHPRAQIQVETSGSLMIPNWDWGKALMVCSPKTPKVKKAVAAKCMNWKYVVSSEDAGMAYDGLPMYSTQIDGRVQKLYRATQGEVFLTPMDVPDAGLAALNVSYAVDTCLHQGYTLCLQIHKIIGVR